MIQLKKSTIALLIIGITAVSFTSCATPMNVQKESEKVAGYTLKNKKELMQQKIASKKSKTVIATP